VTEQDKDAQASGKGAGGESTPPDFRSIVREAIGEYFQAQKAASEPAYKAELAEERRKREQLERRLNDLAQETERARQRAEEAERSSAIRTELQKLGVAKVDLAFRAVKDDVVRNEQGRLVVRDSSGEIEVRDYLARFVQENPELLPARVTGGAGASINQRPNLASAQIDLDSIRPGMDPAELDRVRKEISRLAQSGA